VTDFSLTLWIKPKVEFNSASGEIQIVRTVGGRYELTYNVCGSGIGTGIAYLCGTQASSATTLAAATWYHIAGTMMIPSANSSFILMEPWSTSILPFTLDQIIPKLPREK